MKIFDMIQIFIPCACSEGSCLFSWEIIRHQLCRFRWLRPCRHGIPGCDSAVLPAHNCADMFHAGNSETSLCAPAPDGVRAGARGLSSLWKEFSPEHE